MLNSNTLSDAFPCVVLECLELFMIPCQVIDCVVAAIHVPSVIMVAVIVFFNCLFVMISIAGNSVFVLSWIIIKFLL